MRKLRIIILLFFLAVLGVFISTEVRDRLSADSSAPVIRADLDAISVSVTASEEELLAGMRAIDNLDGDVTDTLAVVSKSKFITKGTLRVNYAAFDNNNNVGLYSRNVTYYDYTSPRFTISQPLRFLSGNSGNDYLQNVSVIDCLDGNISQQIRITLGETTAASEHISQRTASLMVTNSAGDNAVLPVIILFEEYNTYNMRSPALKDYVIYVKAGTRPNLRANLLGVWAGGKVTLLENTTIDPDTDITIDESNVNYAVSGLYTVYYRLSQADRYGARSELGTAELTVVVEEEG